MAVGIQMDFEGGTYEQYDEVLRKMGLAQMGPGPAGLISHYATVTDSGLRVVDVWQSQEQFERFAEEQIGPICQEVGLTGPPQMQFFEVHNYLTPNI